MACSVVAGRGLEEVYGRLMHHIGPANNPDDVTLMLWVARAVGYPDRRPVWERLVSLRPQAGTYPVVGGRLGPDCSLSRSGGARR